MSGDTYQLTPIGTITTPFKQKFAIPRQPNLANARGKIILSQEFSDPRVFKSIDVFSHIWVLFLFHENIDKGWKSAVKAPRLGGNTTLGVFASRSTHRPNNIGMSVVKNLGYEHANDQLSLNVEGVDLLDGTPIIDIKPYLPYADAVPCATETLNELDNYHPIPHKEVIVSAKAQTELEKAAQKHPDLPTLIEAVLAQDPRPAYRHKLHTDNKIYRTQLYHYDISFAVTDNTVQVLSINTL